MRIIGGLFKGRSLRTPANRAVRPTTDRLRETLFNILAHRYGDPLRGARVIDLFAGTGALGLEALSRGARFALFVEMAAEPRALIRANVEACGVAGSCRILRRDATRLGAAAVAPFDIAFLDPPYRQGLGEAALAALRDGGWLAPGALCILEEAADAGLAPPPGFTEVERRDFGESQIVLLRPQPPSIDPVPTGG